MDFQRLIGGLAREIDRQIGQVEIVLAMDMVELERNAGMLANLTAGNHGHLPVR